MSKINQVSVTVINPDTRDPETYSFDSPEAAVEFLKGRKNIKKVEIQEESNDVQATSSEEAA